MSIFLLLTAPLIAADGTNIGRVYDQCTGRAAAAQIWSGTPESIADRSMAACRYLEPKLREGVDRMWRTNRDGTVAAPTYASQLMTSESWDRLLKARRDRLIKDIGKARLELRKK